MNETHRLMKDLHDTDLFLWQNRRMLNVSENNLPKFITCEKDEQKFIEDKDRITQLHFEITRIEEQRSNIIQALRPLLQYNVFYSCLHKKEVLIVLKDGTGQIKKLAATKDTTADEYLRVFGRSLYDRGIHDHVAEMLEKEMA